MGGRVAPRRAISQIEAQSAPLRVRLDLSLRLDHHVDGRVPGGWWASRSGGQRWGNRDAKRGRRRAPAVSSPGLMRLRLAQHLHELGDAGHHALGDVLDAARRQVRGVQVLCGHVPSVQVDGVLAPQPRHVGQVGQAAELLAHKGRSEAVEVQRHHRALALLAAAQAVRDLDAAVVHPT